MFRSSNSESSDHKSIPGISVSAVNTITIRTQLVRIRYLHYKTTRFPWKNEGSGTTLATLATTHQGPRHRTRRRSTCRHGHAWIGTESQSNWPISEKPRENQGFGAEGQDSNFWVFSLCFVIVRKVPDGCFRTRLYRSHPTDLVDSGLAFTASPPIPSTRWFDDGTSGSRFGIRTTLRPESIWRRRSSSPIR